METATGLCSVALTEGDRVLARRDEEELGRHIHAERLAVLVDAVLREAGRTFAQIDAVAVGTGPGSYTGLRIGLSTAKGYCFALGRPIIGIGTLDILIAALRDTRQVTEAGEELHAMIDARRMEVFTGDPPRPVILDEAWIASLDPAKRHVVFGDGADKATDLWSSRPRIVHVPGVKPFAGAMAGLAQRRLSQGLTDDLAGSVPFYGKETTPTRREP